MRNLPSFLIVATMLGMTACHVDDLHGVVLGKEPKPSASGKLEGHYEGFTMAFHQDYGSSNPIAMDFNADGRCSSNELAPPQFKQTCHWERMQDRISVFLGATPTTFHQAGDALTSLSRDGIGGGVCIQLAKDPNSPNLRDERCRNEQTVLPPLSR